MYNVGTFRSVWKMAPRLNKRTHHSLAVHELELWSVFWWVIWRKMMLQRGFTAKMCPGGRFKNAYELLILRALKFSSVDGLCIFQCMGEICCVEFQRYPLKFHTKYLTHTLKDAIFIPCWKFKSSQSSYAGKAHGSSRMPHTTSKNKGWRQCPSHLWNVTLVLTAD